MSGSILKEKIAKIVIYDESRVNGGTNWLGNVGFLSYLIH